MTSETTEKLQDAGTKILKLIRLGMDNVKRFVPLVIVLVVLVMSGFAISMESEEQQHGQGNGIRFGAAGRSSSSRMMKPKIATNMMMVTTDMAPRSAPQDEIFATASSSDQFSDPGIQMVEDFDLALDASNNNNNNNNKLRGPLERMLIHEGDLTLETEMGKADNLTAEIEHLVKSQGDGYVQSRSTYKDRYNQRRTTDLQLRVTSQSFSSIVLSIQRLVPSQMVTRVSVSSHDVTEEYVDVSTRADVLDASRTSLKNLMKKANGVQDIMDIHRELNRLTEEYEQARRKAQTLRKSSRLSFLRIGIIESESEKEDHKSIFKPYQKLQLALVHMSATVAFLAETMVYASVWLIAILVLYFGIVGFYKTSSRR